MRIGKNSAVRRRLGGFPIEAKNAVIASTLSLSKGAWQSRDKSLRLLRFSRNDGILSVFLLLPLFLTILSLPAFADEFHYNNILVGERASGMGGTYTALSDDPSGLYYNPAGIVYASGRNLSASVNAFHMTKKHYSGVLGGKGWDRDASALLPNFFGIMQPLGKGRIGLSYAVTDSIIEDQDQTISAFKGCGGACTITRYSINLNNEDTTYNVGPTYARPVTGSLSAGVTVYFHQRRAQTILNEFIIIDANRHELTNRNLESEEMGVRPVVGIMWSPVKKFAIGLTASKTEVVSSDSTIQIIAEDGTSASRIEGDTSAKRKYPIAASVGAAFFPTEALLLSGDFTYYTPVDEVNAEYSVQGDVLTAGTHMPISGSIVTNLASEKVATWNASVGSEYYITQAIALRAGLFTNRANTPKLKSGVSGQPEHINLYGGSLSGSYFSRGTALSLGGSYSRGTGQAQVVGGTNIQDATMQSFTGFLSASYIY